MSALFGAKPLASLSSQLLARKGQAKPAMRSQGFGGFAATNAAAADDLGWNDMGHADTPEPVAGPVLVPHAPEPARPVPVPPVVTLREALTEKIEAAEVEPAPSKPSSRPVEPAPSKPSSRPVEPAPAKPPARPVSLATAARIRRESAKQTKGGKAAFTLRLDAERHLRLRLASALANRSAQAIVTEALDRMLDAAPEVDALVAQLPQPKCR